MPIIAIYAIVAAVLLGIGASGGWSVKSWKDGAEIAKLQSSNAELVAANGKCSVDVAQVRQSVAGIEKAAGDRVKASEAAMLGAKAQAAKHSRTAITITAAPIPADEPQCVTIEREQIEYVAARRGE